MRVEVVMPQMGESIVEGTVVNWHKSAGDDVKRDEDIFTISTDKVDADIPSPADGVLEEILVEVGQTVEVGTVVAFIETDREAAKAREGDGHDPEHEVDGPVSPASLTPPRTAGEPTADATPPEEPLSPQPDGPSGGNGAHPPAEPDVDELRRTRSTPLVRRIAREHGIQDLSIVPGTGISGRVTKSDILAYIERADEMVAEAEQTPAPAPTRSELPRSEAEPWVIESPRVHIWDDDRVEPMSRMRKSIAKHMVMSRRVSPHVQSVWECEWTRVVKAREALRDEFASRGVKLTYTAFLVRAAVEALRANPIVNSALDGDRIVYRSRINVGVATAMDEGLIVPVVKRADELNLLGIARAVNDLTRRARQKQLEPAEVDGGTFTITNPGVFGSLFGIPIINQPQVAILGVGAIQKRVVVDENDAIRIARMNTMCLSFDHRVVDGASADFFMRDLIAVLENFEPTRGD